jgi:hypothetical protein
VGGRQEQERDVHLVGVFELAASDVHDGSDKHRGGKTSAS